jgi:hypothetical protein
MTTAKKAARKRGNARPDSDAELKLWAAIEILPWPHSSQPGPSHQQWDDWNNEHGAILRIAYGLMMLTKDQLAALAGDFEREGRFDESLSPYDASIKFFTDMAKTIEAAKLRLLVGHAVYGLRLDSKSDPARLAADATVSDDAAVQS